MRRLIGWSRRLSIVLVACAVVAGVKVSPAGAAHPLYPLQFTGTSAHGLYSVLVETGCLSAGGQPCEAVPSPTFLYVTVTTSAHPGNGCPGNEAFTFSTGTISSSGTFSVSQAYQGGLTIKVVGRFPTPRSVVGTVSGTHGCHASAFSFSLPRPLITVAPSGKDACYWLTKVPKADLLGQPPKLGGFGQAYDISTGLGQCDYDVDSHGYVGFTMSQQNPGVGAATHVAGLGPDGTEYAHALRAQGDSLAQADATVYFRIGSVWVDLGEEVYRSTNVGAVRQKTLVAARHLYQFLR